MDAENPVEIIGCWRCQTPILNNEQQTELLCHHRMHTACFLQIAHLDYVCPHCNQPLNPNVQVHQPEHTHVDHTHVQTLYETNDAFKKVAQTVAKKRRLLAKTQTAYLSLIKTKRDEVRNQLLAIKAQLEGLTEIKKTEIRESQVYKDYLAATRGYSYWVGQLREQYNCSERRLANALNEKPGFRRFTPLSWRHRRRSNLNYIFYYKIRM